MLQIGIELKVLLNNDEIYFFMENKTEMYELQTREKTILNYPLSQNQLQTHAHPGYSIITICPHKMFDYD